LVATTPLLVTQIVPDGHQQPRYGEAPICS
jgi:hypothetical protein